MRQSLLFSLLLLFFVTGIEGNLPEYGIGHFQHTFIDPERDDRAILTEVYYPIDPSGDGGVIAEGSFPLVVFGHGFVMVWSAYENLWTHFVPECYIMAFPRTEGGLAPSHLNFGMDIAFLVDAIQELNEQAASPLFGGLNGRSAVMGHSMGGGAAVLAASLNDNIDVLLGLAPAETNPSAISAAGSIHIPSLIFSGSSDDVTPEETHQIPIYEALSSGTKSMLSLLGGGHCYFANFNFNCNLGEVGSSGNITITREEQQKAVEDFATPWLNYFLKGDCQAWEILQDSMEVSPRIAAMQESLITPPEIDQQGDSLVSSPASTYQWLLDGSAIPGADQQYLIPLQPGEYQVEVTYYNPCPYTSEPITVAQELYQLVFEVFDAGGQAMEDALIIFDGVNYGEGHYVIEEIPEGEYDYRVEKAGYVPVEDTISLSSDTLVQVTLELEVSVREKPQPDIRLYPNPVRTSLFIESAHLMEEVSLFDTSGQVLYHSSPHESIHELSFQGLRAGVYLLRIRDRSGTETRRIQHIP